jgi:coenzyme F420-0:L-glutamate ligase
LLISNKITIEAVPGVPYIAEGDDIGEVLVNSAKSEGFRFKEGDILCVASKAVSLAEGRLVALDTVNAGDAAKKLHKRIPHKDPRTLQLIIDATGANDLSRLDIHNGYIAGWLPNGNRLTSAGVDKMGPEHVVLLPEDPDKSARRIGQSILNTFNVRVAVVVTDSDGRVEKAGSTQVAIGLYGLPGLRRSAHTNETGIVKYTDETLCDLVAASAGLLMGQRGTNRPAVVIRGVPYEFDEYSEIRHALSQPQ